EVMNEYVKQMQHITQSFGIEFSEEQWKAMIKVTMTYQAENIVGELLIKVLKPEFQYENRPAEVLARLFEAEYHQQDIPQEVSAIFQTIFPNPMANDFATIKRLCETYPSGVVHFALESVMNKAERKNWGYITATIKRLAKNNSTYESCEQSKEAYFNDQNKRYEKIKAEQRQKQKLILRLIELEHFGEVTNPVGYAHKVLNDEKYAQIDIYELFDTLTGQQHINADSYDQQIFEILFPV
ncbi:MAG: hypothetical protein ACRC3A_01025, partial [Culicoidibacterales bacterium]